MSIMVPNEGKIEQLKRVLYGNAGSENGTLKLFKNNITPAETDTAATYTEATFTGYASVTLTSSQSAGTWAVPTITSDLALSQYGTNATFTITAATQTVYGWFIVGASSAKAWYSEGFAAPKALDGTNSDQVVITPVIKSGHL